MYKHILKKKVKNLYKDIERRNNFLNLNDINSILVLFDTSDYDEADAFVEKLINISKTVTVYAFKGKSDTYDYSDTPYNIVTAKDAFDFFDNKMSEIGDRIEGKTYDAVFDLTLERNVPLEYLLARANAKVKVGLKKNDLPQYDVSIVMPNKTEEVLTISELGKQIVFYLHSIKTK
ncbi:hypothetical protein M2138_000693 [Dysgonomonadaceae bacterium PH5-43]|nr:hypothetical protein [Dysgonomonadaceae bacterium PH5-43]